MRPSFKFHRSSCCVHDRLESARRRATRTPSRLLDWKHARPVPSNLFHDGHRSMLEDSLPVLVSQLVGLKSAHQLCLFGWNLLETHSGCSVVRGPPRNINPQHLHARVALHATYCLHCYNGIILALAMAPNLAVSQHVLIRDMILDGSLTQV